MLDVSSSTATSLSESIVILPKEIISLPIILPQSLISEYLNLKDIEHWYGSLMNLNNPKGSKNDFIKLNPRPSEFDSNRDNLV